MLGFWIFFQAKQSQPSLNFFALIQLATFCCESCLAIKIFLQKTHLFLTLYKIICFNDFFSSSYSTKMNVNFRSWWCANKKEKRHSVECRLLTIKNRLWILPTNGYVLSYKFLKNTICPIFCLYWYLDYFIIKKKDFFIIYLIYI